MVLLAALAGTAQAAKPIREPYIAPPATTFPAGLVCPFEVYVDVVENRQTQKTFSDGSVLVTGFFLTRVVNTENEKELTLNSQASVRVQPEGDLLRFTFNGPIIIFFFPGDAGPGDTSTGRAYLFRGNTSFVADEAFAFVSFASSGNATDLCAALA